MAEQADADRGKRYDGFISYSHAADGQLAPRLQAGAQSFAKPWWRRRALLVFRDETGLSVNPHLWSSISDALDDSRWFILLCSPESAQSPWVEREIKHWREHHDPARILPVLTDGEWMWDASTQAFSPGSTAVPPALWDAFDEEPRHLDLRWAREAEQLHLRNGRFRTAVAELAAPMRGVPREELESDEIRIHRRAVRLAWTAAIVLVALSLATAVAAVAAVRNADSARVSAADALDKSRQADSTRLGALAAEEATHGLPDRALLLAVVAADAGGTDTRAARDALLGATGNAHGLERVLSDAKTEPGTLQVGTPILALSPESRWAALADGAGPNGDVVPPISIIDLRDGRRTALAPFAGTVLALQPVAPDRLAVLFASPASTTVPTPEDALPSAPPSDLPVDGPPSGDLPVSGPGATADPGSAAARHVQLFDTGSGSVLYDADAVGAPQVVLGGSAIVVPHRDALELVDVATGRALGAPWPGRIAAGTPATGPARAPTTAPRVVSADGASLVGLVPTSGAQVRWDLHDPAKPVELIPGPEAGQPIIRFDPTGVRAVGISAVGTVVAADADGGNRRERPVTGELAAAFAVGPRAERVVVVGRDGGIGTVDLAGSGSVPSVACAAAVCSGRGSWTAETNRDADVVVVTASARSALPDVDSRTTWFVRLADATVGGPFLGGPVGFTGDPQNGPTGATMSDLGMPPRFASVQFGSSGTGDATTGMPIVAADGTFVAVPVSSFDTSATTQPVTLQSTSASAPTTMTIPYGGRAQAFAVDAEHVIGAATDGQLYLWDRAALSSADTTPWQADVSPDGTRIAQVVTDPTKPDSTRVEVHDTKTAQTRTYAAPGGGSVSVLFDPTGRWLAAVPGAYDGTESWVLDTLAADAAPRRVSATAIVFSDDGQSMAVWQREGTRWKASVGPVTGAPPIGTVSVDDVASTSPVVAAGTDASPPVSALRAGGATLAVRTKAGITIRDVRGGSDVRTLALPPSAIPNDLVYAAGALRSVDRDHEVMQVRAWTDDGTLSGVAEIGQQANRRLVTGPDGLLLVVDTRAPAAEPALLLVGASLTPIGTVDPGMMRFRPDGGALTGVVSSLGQPPASVGRAIDLASLRAVACATAGRELTALEWTRFRPGVEQVATCRGQR
jgi:hypothetical protein